MLCSTQNLMSCLFLAASCLFIGTHQEEENPLTKDWKFKLISGDSKPLIGIGTYRVVGDELVKEVLDNAFAAGYRSIDTAAAYNNEASIGKALKELLPKHNLTRQDIFITTKLIPSKLGGEAYQELEKSLRNLDSGYIDLYLIHFPGLVAANDTRQTLEADHSKLRDQSWQHLVKGVKNGLTRNIGVSNYVLSHLRELMANDHGVKPALNQVEWHPNNHVDELKEYCNKEGVLLEAYFSLGGSDDYGLLADVEVKKIAERLGKTPAQVLLRWALQQNISIIPKSRSRKHLDENLDLNFELSEEDMRTLGGFPQKKWAWDPYTVA